MKSILKSTTRAPFLERTLWDDVKLFLGVLAGMALGCLVFGRDDLLVVVLECAVAAAVMIIVLSLVRRFFQARRHVGNGRAERGS